MQEKRRRAGTGKRCRDFSSDQPGLTHSAYNHAALASEEQVHGAFEAGIEPRQHVLYRLCLDLKHPARGTEAHGALQRRTSEESSLSRASKPASCESGRAFAPSERATAGLSCVSRKMPSMPAATAARANGSMNSGCPPLAWPWPPGSCTECVPSKTTGKPS